MSYGVALRNGVPFTLGTIAALCVNATGSAWSPLALWPNGISSPGMWSSPSTLPASFNDYTGTTPVATPGTVADSANPVGLALDIRAGAPGTLGPELVVNGDFAVDLSGVTAVGDYVITRDTTIFPAGAIKVVAPSGGVAGGAVINVAGLTAGKPYILTASIYSPSSNATQHPGVISWPNNDLGVKATVEDTVEDGQYVFYPGSSSISLVLYVMTPTVSWGAPGDCFYATNISVREVPGNHMLQSTSSARPLMSARRNLLTYTEDFSNAVWAKADVSITPNSITSPDGGVTASKVTSSGSVTTAYVLQLIQNVALFSHSFYAKAGTSNFACFTTNTNACYANFNISTGSVASYSNCTAAISAVGDGWYRCSITEPANGIYFMILGKDADPGAQPYGTGVWASGNYIYLWGPQLQYGPSVVTPYQSVPGDGSTYATGITPFQLYDGTDDGMATVSFAAGTLINGMDCMIPVRRDSGANAVCGLYQAIADATKFFGMAESGSGSGCVGSGAGTPTVWVDNTQLTGGTAVTRGTLHTALTAGSYHILEFRNLDLSAWTASGFGLYTSYKLLGARGDIMLYPSTASTADKDKARQYLADKYGVTLA